MKKLLLTLLLLASSAMGQTDISSLPYTISTSGTYNLTVDDTVTATAITITANNVTLNFNGHTVGFGTSKANNTRGVIADGYDNITVTGPGTINYCVDDTVAVADARGIALLSGEYNVVRGMTVNMTGYGTSTDATYDGIDGIAFGYDAAYMCRAVSCTVTCAGAGFYSRSSYPSRAITIIRNLTHSISDSTTEYHLWVDSCVVGYNLIGVQAVGGLTADYGNIWVSNNYITGNLRNEMPYVGYRIGDGYAIHMASIASFKIWNNVCTYGTAYNGGYGIFLEGSSDTSVYGFGSYVYNNACTASVGGWNNVDGTDNTGHGTALRLRYQAEAIYIYNNTFVAYSDMDATTGYRNGRAVAINIGSEGAVDLLNLKIYNNKAVAIGDNASEAYAVAIADKNTTNDFVLYNNLLQSNNVIVQLGFDDDAIQYLVQHDDTLEHVQDSGNTMYTYDMNIGSWGTGNPIDSFTAINCVYNGGAYDTSIYIYPNAGLVQEILIKYTITITAQGNNSYPVENASVWCVDGFGDTVFTGTTNASGQYTDTVQTWYEEYGNTDDFNDFVVGVAYSGDSTYSASTVSDSTRTFTRVLASTAGSGGINGNKKILIRK